VTDQLAPVAAARRLGVSVRTLDRYVADGRLTPTGRTAGGHRRFDVEAVDRLKAELDEQTPPPPPIRPPTPTELPGP
jgi:excisionase family DNA binding protein